MQAMLEELNALEGVLGSLRCDAAGQVLARALPAEQLDADVAGAAAAVAETAAELDAAAGGVTHLDLHYAQRRVIVRPTGDGAVVLICEKSVNPKKLVPAVIEVLRRHAGPAPRATTPRAPIRSPSPPTAPAERPDLGDGSSSLPAWRRPPVLAAGVAALVLVLGAAWWLARRPGAAPAAAAATAKAGAQQATIPAVVALRIGGAKSFAAELAPALAKAYLESLQATDVKVSKQDMHRFEVRGMVGGAPWVATIEGLNTPDGFGQLSAGKLDVAMSGRRIKPEWQAKLEPFGSMMVPGREHVVALSGLAIIVNQANLVPQLNRAQLADVFSGAVTDWSKLGAKPGPAGGSAIHVYSGDDKIGITELFRTFILGTRPYTDAAKRLGSVQALNDAVALDPQGIGYAFLPFVRGTRAVPVSESDEQALLPTAFTLATEDYFLTHRVYFYTLPKPENPDLLKFMQFVLGPEGQAVVKKSGFVELSVAASPREPPPDAPREYVRLTGGATRLSSTFRFETASADFDTRALMDLERVTGYLVENRLNGAAVRVLGFADSVGRPDVNRDLSRTRAEQVVKALAQRGITGVAMDGFGAALPVASNANPEGRQRNRRVEVWVAR